MQQIRQWDNRQLGTVVRDMDKVLAYYASLDLGPMAVRDSSFPGKLRGNPFTMNLKIGLSVEGSTLMEVIQPAPDAITHTQTLATRGEGGHHLGIFVGDLAAEVESWAKVGIEPIYRGTTPRGTIELAYMDTAHIGGVVFEFIRMAPPLAESLELGMKLSELRHVGIVVKDLDRTVEFYSSLGLGSFTVREAAVENLQIAGKSGLGSFKVRIANSQNLRLPVELIQPLSGSTIFHETLEQQGEGIQHAACWVPDLDKELARLGSLGVHTLMRNERFAYLETRSPGGLIIELLQRPSA